MTKMHKTVGDIIEKLQDLERKRAVYEDVHAFLSRFVSTDSYTPTKGIRSPIGGEDVVPEETISVVIEEVEELLREVDGDMEVLRTRPTKSLKRRKNGKE